MAISPSKPQTRSFTRALSLAFNEWLLILMLFINSIFSYLITKFADYSDLQSPCLMCSSLDHILGRRTKHLKKSHWDMVCSKHKTEISSLVYCHAHGKLVDVRGMCEACLFSFATTNKSNAETYRLLVGKLGEDSSSFGGRSKSDPNTGRRYCTCCNQLWMMPQQTGFNDQEVVAKPVTLPKIRVVSSLRTGKQSNTPKKSVSFNHLPDVGYTELKVHSDTESEAVFSEDEGVVAFKEKDDHKFQNVDLETPRVITLPYDMATDKLLDLDFPSQEIGLRSYDSFFPETSEKVLKEKEMSSLDSLFFSDSAAVLKEKEDLIHFQDVSLTPDASMEETELVPVNVVPEETSKKVLKEEEVPSLDSIFFSLRSTEPFAAVSKETEFVSLRDIISTSSAAAEALLMREAEGDLVQLLDLSLTQDSKERPADASVEEAGLICLNDATSTTSSDAAETPEGDVLMGETVLKEKEDLVHPQDVCLGEDFEVNPADALMEKTELLCLNDLTSTSSDASETPEDILKGSEQMPLHDTSPDEVPESFTTNETPVETSKERDTSQDDIASLEPEYVVVSPSKSAQSMPEEDSTEDCVSEDKETKETMASQTEAAPVSESASFNSMSVAADTNLGSGELLDLADTYNSIPHNEGSSNDGEAHIEHWMKKDTSRVSEDLKTLLTHISSSRGIELLSPRGISPKISTDQETKDLDLDMQLLIQKRMLERNESNLSLEEVSVSEIEGESESDRLKRQVDYDRKLLTGLYKELEEERSASAVATNQAMAMITRLQEEKALFQMEALQNLRMMEEQAEYDMEAIQKLNDLLVDKEKLIQDLEAEIEYFRDQTPQKKKLDVAEIDSSSETVSNKIQNCLTGFNEERLYITSCLENLENRVVQRDVNSEAHDDDLATQESVSELGERVEKLKGDLYFLEHVVNSLGHGDEGVQFVKEIASHLQTLRSLSMKRRNDAES
ncbi:myosin-binding protein 1 isoform X1 [Brassica rapa]|uniref:GTD-binding domain-containing protein n=1 Tax=Brassica campestris TaxID=3711 RepID=M4DQ08_BRACM|nr:myosin-binding protein 1 isoform X1 [Brassica rapa]XP_033128885.1 myosin-binding protein 1 isoform X1 [Brassica rapa]